MTRSHAIGRIDILGVPVSTTGLGGAVAAIEDIILRHGREYVCITGAHGVIESRRDARLQAIHEDAGLVTADGMPVVWLARALGARETRRVYGPDLMKALTELSARRGYRQFYYGGAPGVADKLASELIRRNPQLKVVGTICPPFRPLMPAEDDAVVDAINRSDADIVWIGLSTPKQEYWMAEHRRRLNAPVLVGVGAAFDFLSGSKRQAPRWMQRSGLEWLFRLLVEPRRLWRRYAVIVPSFALLAFRRWAAATFRLGHGSPPAAIR
jgi:N-acetylglucosaminyldiphosphoundecaprenol N-acetyl-beta-D-mannosaminyltransferase